MSYTEFYQKYGFGLLQKLLRRPTLALFEELRVAERLDGPSIRARQLARLNELYRHAREEIPLYRRLYADGPDDIANFEQFSALPILDRHTVGMEHQDMVFGGVGNPRVQVSRTGGSSGEPLTFYTFDGSAALGLAMMMRGRAWWNIDFNERNGLFIEHGLKFENDVRSKVDRVLHKVREAVLNRRFFSAYRMSGADMQGYYEELARFKPSYLIGYASFLYLFAKHLRDNNLAAQPLGVRCIFYTSEMLYPWQRELIESVFDCPVVGEYGCKEVGVIAYQCPQNSWHTMDESVYVEIVPLDDAPGFGEVIVTQLKNDDSPFIRYRTGDVARLLDPDAACGCGRGLHVMGSIQGRSHDWIMTPSGKVLHGQIFTHALIVRGSVVKFRVRQSKDYSIRIQAVVNNRFSEEEEAFIIKNISEIIGEPLAITFEKVHEIESGRSGKFRWIESEISIYDRAPVDP